MLTMPDSEWFWAEVADALLALTISDNWEKAGDVSIDDAVSSGADTFAGFKSMVGTIFPVCWQTIPDSFLLCDGSTYLRVDYPSLYANLPAGFIIDADSFAVPALNGKTIVGAGSGFSPADVGGEVDHTLIESEIPSHAHTTTATLPGLAFSPGELPVLVPGLTPNLSGFTGGSGAHNNMQPYQAITYVIAAR